MPSPRSEHCERSNQTRIARRRAEEEGGDTPFVPERRRSRRPQGAIRARDVRAADLQEEPTKRVEQRADSATRSFRRIRRRRRLPGDIAASGASHETERAQRAEQSNTASRHAIRARDVCAADLQEERRNASNTELILRHGRFVGFDEDGGFPANIAASGASHETQRAQGSKQSSTPDQRENRLPETVVTKFLIESGRSRICQFSGP
jgi:hypothetical protein